VSKTVSNQQAAELRAAIISLDGIKRNIPNDIFRQFMERHLSEMVLWTNRFIHSPETSGLKISYISKIMGLLTDIHPIELAERYYDSIDLVNLVRLLRYESASFVTNFLQTLMVFLNRPDQKDKQMVQNKIISVFHEIKLSGYSDELNNKLVYKWSQFSKPNYLPKDNASLATTIARVSEPFIKAAAALDDEDEKQVILSEVVAFYSAIEWKLVGKLIEAYRIGFGSICKLIEMLRKSKCNKVVINDMLTEVDFVRIARDYNHKPINNAHLSFFCKFYLSKQSASLQWKSFFETINLQHIREKGSFNFADTSFMLQLLTQIYHDDRLKLLQLLEQLDLFDAGVKARGKDEIKLNNLFIRLLKARLNGAQYAQFLEGFGREDCLRLSGNRYFDRIAHVSGLKVQNVAEN
jgi:hypothetical protein